MEQLLPVAGLGMAVLPTFIVHDAIRKGDLEIVLREYMPRPITMYAVFPRSKGMPARMRAFIDFLVSSFSDHPFWDQDILTAEELSRVP